MRTRSPRAWLLLAGLTASACKTAGSAAPPPPAAPPRPPAAEAPFAFRATDEARAAVGFVASIAAPERAGADLDAMARRIGLPMPLGESLLGLLAGGTRFGGLRPTRAQLARLDPAARSTVVVVARPPAPRAPTPPTPTPPPPTPRSICAAFTFKDAGQVAATLDELAPPVATVAAAAGPVTRRRAPGGAALWSARAGRTAVLANEPDALAACGAIAIERQGGPAAGLVDLSFYPHPLAAADGTTVEALVAAIGARSAEALVAEERDHEAGRAAGRKRPAAGSSPSSVAPGMRKLLLAGWQVVGAMGVESRRVRLVLDAGPAVGLRLRTELEPTAGTPFAARTAAAAPFALDDGFAPSSDAGLVAAAGGLVASWRTWSGVVASTGPAGVRLRGAIDGLVELFAGQVSCVGPTMVPMRARCSYALAPGVKEAAALDRYAATVKAYDAWERELLGRQVGRSRVRRGAGGLTVDRTILVATPEERAMYAALYAVDGRGGSLIRSTARVRGGRLVLAVGGADEEAPPPAAAAPIAAAALAEARGADAVAIFDPASFLLQAGGRMPGPQGKQVAAMTTAIPGLGTLAAPLVVTSRGGPAATVELAVPIGTLVNVAQVVRPFLGVMGAGAR